MPGPTHLIHPPVERRKGLNVFLLAWVASGVIWIFCGLLSKIFPRSSFVCDRIQEYAFLVQLAAGALYVIWRFIRTAIEVRQDENKASRVAKGLCSECGYNLRGNVSGACPECGMKF